MAETALLSGLELTKWQRDFIRETVRDSGFAPYMGNAETDIIRVRDDLEANGYTIRIPLVGRLTSAGVTGNTRLSGAEESLDQYYQDVTWAPYRNGVEISWFEKEKAGVDLLGSVRPLLREWFAELIKYQVIDTFHTMSDGVTFAASAAAARNTFITNNSDRVLFGAARANGSSNVMATALATVNSAADLLTPAVGSLGKRMARLARPIINPFKTGMKGREFYVMFCHPFCFRDLKNSTAMQNANREARPRDVEANPLFQDGDLIYDGVIYREMPEFYQARTGSGVNTNTHLTGVGAAGIDVGVNFLCGTQAVGYVNKQAPKPVTKKEDDYGFFDGIGIQGAQGMSKLRWNNGAGTNKDFGMVTVYASATGDA